LSQSVRAKFIELSSSWLQRVNHGDSVLRHYALLEILADSDGMAVQLAGSLVKSIAESQQRMNEWEWDGTELLIPRPVLTHFSSASYYFLLLEKTIPRMAPSDKSRFVMRSVMRNAQYTYSEEVKCRILLLRRDLKKRNQYYI
jgi:hypothetical protein